MSDPFEDSLLASPPPNPLSPTEAERARIRELLKKLKPSALKYLSADLPDASNERTNFYDILIEHLQKTDLHWRERTVAAWGMGFANIPVEKRTFAITVLRNTLLDKIANKPRRAWDRWLYGVGWTYRQWLVALPFLLLLLAYLAQTYENKINNWAEFIGIVTMFSFLLTTYALPFTVPLSMVSLYQHNNEARAMAAKALLRQNALEGMPEILEGSLDKAWKVKDECRQALHHFLPQIMEANQDVMPANTEALLSRILLTTYDIEHGAVIVDYLEKFGRGSSHDALSKHLRELRSDYGGSLTKLKAYEAKVERVLALLLERQTQDNTRQELLRHSSIPIMQSDQLLRPAADAQTTPAEQLLRASQDLTGG